MGYINPLLDLPAGRRLQELPPEQRAAIAEVMRDLRHQANDKAEESWQKRKGPMAAYWRAVSTYARHLAHALTRATDNPSPTGGVPSGAADVGGEG